MSSRASGRGNTFISNAGSVTMRVMGPITRAAAGGSTGMRPWLGLMPNTPQKLAGIRTEPPMSKGPGLLDGIEDTLPTALNGEDWRLNLSAPCRG